MVPGQQIRLYFARHHDYQAVALYEPKQSTYPTSFSVHVTCLDVLADDQPTEEFTVLDFEHLLAGNRTSFQVVETADPEALLHNREAFAAAQENVRALTKEEYDAIFGQDPG